VPETVQRWRIVYGRGAAAARLTQREENQAWETAIAATGLPARIDARGRPKLGPAVPLPVGLTALAERLDIWLDARRPHREVRAAIASHAPADHSLLDVHDVWVGAPPLAAAVVALDYRLRVGGAAPGDLERAGREVLASPRVERPRRRADRDGTYDLRPFITDVRIESRADGPEVWMRLMADPSLGVGRPDEVVAAMGSTLRTEISIEDGVRERLWLDDEVGRAVATSDP
jgi:hypothetical protein